MAGGTSAGRPADRPWGEVGSGATGAGGDAPQVHYPVTATLARNAEDWIERGGTPVPTKDASTVLLLRDGGTPGDLEVFVLRRAATMAFAPSVYVFPGGGVDQRDADASLPWIGPGPDAWGSRLAAAEPLARELVVAAARELFEECGVLLAGPDADAVVADLTGPGWDTARAELVARELSFADVLLRHGLALRTDLLRAVDHWITPVFEPRRYDTRFFVAALPAGQVPDDDCTEAEHVRWVRPADLLAESRAGQAMLMPPTAVSLERLCYDPQAHERGGWDGSVASLMRLVDGGEPLPAVMPEAVHTPDGVVLVHRWVPVDAAGDGTAGDGTA